MDVSTAGAAPTAGGLRTSGPSSPESPYGAKALAVIRAHPRFREACETAAADALARREAHGSAAAWLTRDAGRAGILGAAAILDALAPAGATVRDLAAAVAGNQSCSRGRVLAFVDRAIDAGWMAVPAGSEPWTRRRLTLKPPFYAHLRRRCRGTLEATCLVAPDAAPALARLEDPGSLRLFLRETALVAMAHPELTRMDDSPLKLFLDHEAGMMVLQHWLLSQPPSRKRLLEAAPISRRALGGRFEVSRAHLNDLIAGAQAAGLMRLTASDRARFDPALSDELEVFYALQFQCGRRAATAILRPTV